MSTITVLCEPSEVPAIQIEIMGYLLRTNQSQFLSFASLGPGHLVMNRVNRLVPVAFATILAEIDSCLKARGFTLIDEGNDCILYKR